MVWLGLLGVASLTVVGLAFALLDAFAAPMVALVATAVTVAGRVAAGPPPWAGEGGELALGVAVAVVALTGLGNVWFAGQHHATERDPGVYVETALWLEEEGTLLVDGIEGPFAAHAAAGEPLRTSGLGFFDVGRDDGRLHPQFTHGTAVVLAAAEGLGGARVTSRVPALLTALASLALWFAARPLVGAWGATLAVTISSVSLLSIHHARDTFSEPLATVFVVGAVAVLGAAGKDARLHAVAGAFAGLAFVARIDAVIVVLGLAALVVVRGRGRPQAALVAGAAAGVALGLVDLTQRSELYYEVNRSSILGPVATAAVVAAVGLVRPRFATPSWWTPPRRRVVAVSAGALVIAGVVFALWVRPEIETARQNPVDHVGALQERQGLDVEPDRTYAEESLVWLSWYLGVPAVLAAGFGGAAVVGRTIARGETRWYPLVALTGPITLLYLWRPRIVPDQLWATRRFVPATLPLLAVLAAFAVVLAVRATRRRAEHHPRRGLAVALVGVAAVLAVTVPAAAASAPFADDETLWWPRRDVEDVCPALGDGAAVLIEVDAALGDHLMRSLARSCSVPVATGPVAGLDLATLAEDWQAAGRSLVVVAPPALESPELAERSRHLLRITRPEASVERPPERIERFAQEVAVYAVVGAAPDGEAATGGADGGSVSG